jgi:hypothetical protein
MDIIMKKLFDVKGEIDLNGGSDGEEGSHHSEVISVGQ